MSSHDIIIKFKINNMPNEAEAGFDMLTEVADGLKIILRDEKFHLERAYANEGLKVDFDIEVQES